ncbi:MULTISPECIES: hypothetical protein [unclassified Burkholderia]|uniref:hypothetical protein n=1 Tax=unclassified Burkholderia TaxID=2613784 RepID=UPI0016399D2C|nr:MULTISPECIES: hypothetical protein [unclassified Burkholderia]
MRRHASREGFTAGPSNARASHQPAAPVDMQDFGIHEAVAQQERDRSVDASASCPPVSTIEPVAGISGNAARIA